MSDDEVIYDEAEYHFGAEGFPPDLPERQAFVHTGMYLGWIIDRGLFSESFAQEAAEEIAGVRSGKVSGTDVYERWDGALVGDMLSAEGNAFSQWYYGMDKGRYLKDYHALLGQGLPSLYQVADTRANYERMRDRIDERFAQWTKGRNKKFWEFWK